MELKEVLALTIPSVLPTLMVLFGILSNKNDINHVRTEIASMRGELSNTRTELRGEIASVRTDLRTEISNVRAELGAFRAQVHADLRDLVNISNDLDKRVSRLEDKG